jgi:hypothetical protein
MKIARFFLYYVFKNPPNELLLCCVHCTVYTETPYHECTPSHQLRTMTLRSHIHSVPWMNAVTPTPYHECTQLADSVKSLSFSFTRGFFGPIAYIHGTELVTVGVTPFIHGTELMRFGKVTLRSKKISIKWLWPVKVTLEVIKRRLLVFCWSCDEDPLK